MPIPRKGTKSAWRPPPGGTENVNPLIIAEPKHRLGPAGISSGISTRKYPRTTVQKVREICLHYVEKCSGKYEFNKVAARYVHQMADEIIGQLDGVASQLKNTQTMNPENLQELLNDWQKNFPPSLGNYGTPKNVAATLERYTKELQDLRKELENERSKRANDVADVMKSMDAQLQRSSEGVMSERRQLSYTQHQQSLMFEHQLRDTESQYKAKITTMTKGYEEKIKKIQEVCTKKVEEVDTSQNQLKQELQQVQEVSTKEVHALKTKLEKQSKSHIKTVVKLERDIMAAQGLYTGTTPHVGDMTYGETGFESPRGGGLDSGPSFVSLFPEDTSTTLLGASMSDIDTTTPRGSGGPESETARKERLELREMKKQAHDAKLLSRQKKGPMKLSGPVGKAVKALKEVSYSRTINM